MKRTVYEKNSPLGTLLEWLITLVVIVWLVRLAIAYLYQHLGIVIGVVLIAIGLIIGIRVLDYRRRTRW